jgi:hypothetical protein
VYYAVQLCGKIFIVPWLRNSRGGSVSIVIQLRNGRPGFDSRQGHRSFSLLATASGPTLGPTQRPIKRPPEALSLWVQWPGREADHSPPSSAEVQSAWSYTSTPLYVFTALCLVKHRMSMKYVVKRMYNFTRTVIKELYWSWGRCIMKWSLPGPWRAGTTSSELPEASTCGMYESSWRW